VVGYYHRFLKKHNQLPVSQKLLARECNRAFFLGFHPGDQEILIQWLYTMRPNHNLEDPYDMEDVFEAARGYFSNAQFYCPPQHCLCNTYPTSYYEWDHQRDKDQTHVTQQP
jgi:hypothetical protein